MDEALAKMLDLEFFHSNGYARKHCADCKQPFWTTDAARTLCGDSTCVEYSFLGDPLTKRPLGLADMREAFQDFFEKRGHTRVPRNPVVARWRDDIYLNIASIANYQPHVTSGDVPPPANPLVVSQPCIRLNDLANIGRSGRHFSCFEMMGHHAFNSPEWGEHYWTDACVQYGAEFLTKTLGLDGDRITFKESTWSGGGNAGPCVEVFAGGLEVATLVFMCLEEREGGGTTIKGDTYGTMDLRIIDTGWGLERLAWASTGTPTAYDTVFPDAIAQIKDLASVPIADDQRSAMLVSEHARVQGILNLDIGTRLDGLRREVVKRLAAGGVKTDVDELTRVMEPIEAMYGLADHLRCLSFMVGDGIVPSNVKAGYLMRLVTRRALRFKDQLGIKRTLGDLLSWNMEQMTDFPEFGAAVGRAREIAALETERHKESRERGLRLVGRLLAKKKSLGIDELVDLYDTHGLGPNVVAEAAAHEGVTVEVPDTFDAIVAERHSKEKKQKAARLVPDDVPATRRIFYEHDGDSDGQWQQEFDAEVTWAGKVEKGVQAVVLSQTCFFHETGGQPGDRGHLAIGKKRVVVLDTTKDQEHCVHHVQTDTPLTPGTKVHGIVDWELRMDHTRSHTATHIMNQSVRRVLGSHSWQAGTQKYADCARVDMTHFRRPSREELAAIEQLANAVVMQGRPVVRRWFTREEAERTWGLQLLQGGIPKGRDVRVVRIGEAPEDAPPVRFHGPDGGAALSADDFDVEYCGGTHCLTTHGVGPIRLYRTERIQDGVERFEYSAGLHAVARWQEPEAHLRAAAEALDVAPAEVPNAARRFFDEWKERGKLSEQLQKQLAELAAGAAVEGEDVNGVTVVARSDLPAAALQKTAEGLVRKERTVVLLAAADGDKVRLLFARSADVDLDMGAVLRKAAVHVDGKGGGRPDFAQGGGTKVAGLDGSIEAARQAVRQALA